MPRSWGGRKAAALTAAVLERDNYVCQLQLPGICKQIADTADHIIPGSKGGPDTMDNLRAACRSCNSSRGNRDEPNPPANEPNWLSDL